MNQKIELARKAVYEALRLRKQQDLQLWQAICIYDLAEELGLRVYFDAIPSMEGMYMNGSPPRIILSSLRPTGRMVYTCIMRSGIIFLVMVHMWMKSWRISILIVWILRNILLSVLQAFYLCQSLL